LGATTLGRELPVRVAAKLKTGLTAHCFQLYINEESRLVQVVPGLARNTMEAVEVIVAGGWELHSVGGIEPIKELAKILGEPWWD